MPTPVLDGPVAGLRTPRKHGSRRLRRSARRNFCDGTLSHEGTAARLADGLLIAFVDGRRDGADGQLVRVGIRPEHTVPDVGSIMVEADLPEPLGSETILIRRPGGGRLIAGEIPGGTPASETVDVAIPPKRIHVFVAESGLRLDAIALATAG